MSHTEPTVDAVADTEQVRDLYRQRAELVAYFAGHHPARLADNDPTEPGRVVLYVTTAEGQLSWHIDRADLDLFAHVPWCDESDPDVLATFDGHSTDEKRHRLRSLTRKETRR